MKKISSTILLSAICLSVFGQNDRNLYGFEKSNSVLVSTNVKLFSHAWAGGINSAQVSTIDLNLDGNLDLVIFDKQGKSFQTYLSNGSGSSGSYEYAPQYEKAFPKVPYNSKWALLRDYNCDGKKDLFMSDGSYFYVWENTSGSFLSFSPANNGERIKTEYSNNFTSNLYVNGSNIPGLIDIDNDNAIDLLTYVNGGIEMEYHKGQTPCGLDFAVQETCWGHFTETGYTKAVELNACTPRKKKTLHDGSAILPLDLNNDQVKDIILGNVSFQSLTAVYNGGDLDSAHMVSQDTAFPPSTPVDLNFFPASYFEDVDFDGVPDLLVSTGSENSDAVNKKSLYLYKNTGTTNAPNFIFQQEDFLQENMLDFGQRSVPRLVDLSGDGLLDLVVSNYLMSLKDSTSLHRYWYFKNTGTAASPSFTLVDDNFMDISSYVLAPGSIPAFGDLDGDGDMDAIVGEISGILHYFTNNSSTTPDFTLSSAGIQSIDVGNNAAPFLFDIDSNGTLDLLIGNDRGNVFYYSNSSSTSPNFSLEDSRFGGVTTSSEGNTYGYSTPYMFRNNGVNNLFVGSQSDGVFQFDSIKQVMSKPSLYQPIIGTGNIVSSNSDESPLGIKRKNGRNQMLITMQELRDAGLVYGYINGFSLKVTSQSNNYIDNIYIRIKETSDTVLTDFEDFSNILPIFNQRTKPNAGWEYYEFNKPFLWSGNKSIIIEICFKGSNSNKDVEVEMTDVGFGANAYGDYVDPTLQGDGCAQPYLATSSLRPNIKLVVTPAFAHTENYANGVYTAPAVADLNNDGFMDMIVGNMNGGLSYYEGKVYDVGLAEPPHMKTSNLNVYPNPGHDRFIVNTPYVGEAEIFVIDLSGKQILSQKVHEAETEINLQNHPKGMYLFIYKSAESLKTGKVIKH